jgi:hypothetical protein
MKTIRLLTIGNSFADNALTYLEALATSAGSVRFEVGRANLGGCSLEKHWNLAVYTEKHPEYKTYRLGAAADGEMREANLQEILPSAPWDYVTLQQVSHKSWRRETFQPYLGLLHELVRRQAPQARILLHQTWAYRTDTPFLPQNSLTQELMFERIRAAYAHFAAELDCGVLPSGEAVQQARRAPGRTFTWPEPGFDYQHAEAPALPKQEHSLAAGWHWAINNSPEGIPEMRLDANHLNGRGCYLTGCVWFECLTGLDVRSVAFRPDEIDAETATFLRATAHDVCLRYGSPRAM